MKLQFLGQGGAFATLAEGNTNACLTINGKNLLIDFGILSNVVWRDELGKSFHDIDALYISHNHLDHCCLETLAFHNYFIPKLDDKGRKVKPKLFANPEVLKEIWDGMSPSMRVYRNEIMHITNFFECHACADFVFEGVECKLHRNQHINSAFGSKDSYGLTFTLGKKRVYFSTDSANINIQCCKWADIIFHDCETSKCKSGVHANYEELRKLPIEAKNKMWLMHYSRTDNRSKTDGFAGFVKKGDIFDFSA